MLKRKKEKKSSPPSVLVAFADFGYPVICSKTPFL
jgi:hypothetical protein